MHNNPKHGWHLTYSILWLERSSIYLNTLIFTSLFDHWTLCNLLRPQKETQNSLFMEFWWLISHLLVQRQVQLLGSGNCKETQRDYLGKETRTVDHSCFSFAQQYSTSQCCCNCESLELLGLGNSSTFTIQAWSGIIGLPSVCKGEKHNGGERFHYSEDVQIEVQKWLCAQGPLLWRTWQIDVSLW